MGRGTLQYQQYKYHKESIIIDESTNEHWILRFILNRLSVYSLGNQHQPRRFLLVFILRRGLTHSPAWPQTCHTAKASTELLLFLPLPSECLDYRYALPTQRSFVDRMCFLCPFRSSMNTAMLYMQNSHAAGWQQFFGFAFNSTVFLWDAHCNKENIMQELWIQSWGFLKTHFKVFIVI